MVCSWHHVLSEVRGFSAGVITVVIALASMVLVIAAGGVAFSLLLVVAGLCHLCGVRLHRADPALWREGLDESGLGPQGIRLVLER